MLEISPSGINLYLTCPLAFKFKYIDKLEPQIQDNTFLTTGKLVHKSLELYFKDKMENGNNKLKPTDYLEKASEDFKDMNPLLLDEAIEEADHYLTIYSGVAVSLKPLASEEYFELELSDNILLRGIIDLIVQEGRNRALIDFKTTRTIVKDNHKYTLQLSLYSLTNKADAYYLHYITPTHVQVKEIKPIDKNLLLNIVSNIENSVKTNTFPPTGIGTACYNCPFKKYCEFSNIK